MVRSLVVAAVLALVGCGGGGDEKPAPSQEPVCEAGRVVECPCEGGGTATQTCKADGSAWGACSCEAPSEDPKVQCSLPQDQSDYLSSERCRTGEIMYAKCEDVVIDNGTCSQTSFGAYCCPG